MSTTLTPKKFKLIALPLVLGSMLILSACGGSEVEEPNEAIDGTTTEETIEEPMVEPEATEAPVTQPE